MAWIVTAILGLLAASPVSGQQPEHPDVDFVQQVEPILRARCFSCHGAKRQKGELRLDRREDALHGSETGKVLVPGDSSSSLLYQLVAGLDATRRMPPKGRPLTAAQVTVLRDWIDQGADWPDAAADAARSARRHWSFQPIRSSDVPEVQRPEWVRNPIDAFILERLESAGVEPSPEADPVTLVRRLHLDLVGLPPSTEDVRRFVSDASPEAYESLVDRLLASPHYGEKWALHWLDQARYADSDGFEIDHERPFAWRYRHWVIDALNADLPFDEFTVQQIAGDLLPASTSENRVATGFQRNAPLSREAGTKPEHSRFEQIVDRTNTFGTVWLGLSVRCAQCHDHKFDPVSQQEYYQLFAFFDSTEDVDVNAPLPGEFEAYEPIREEHKKKTRELLLKYDVPATMRAWERRMRGAAENPGKNAVLDLNLERLAVFVDRGVDILRKEPSKRTQPERKALLQFFLYEYAQLVPIETYIELKYRELIEKLAELDASDPQISTAQAIREDPRRTTTHIHVRGDFFQPTEEVQAETPSILPALGKSEKPNRLDLARWIVAPENPLTARVIVNRQWQELFGSGLVTSSDDFGTQGARPTHPALLDWLATEFRDGGWSLKRLHRQIVTSAAYRQSSRARPDLESTDPANTLVARQARFRLPAELIRDSALRVSGLLNPSIGGPSIKPPQPPGFAVLSEAGAGRWRVTEGPDALRRGLYIHFQRTAPYPQLTGFDAPDATLSCSRRRTSNTPLQALNLLNDPVFLEAAQALARQILARGPATAEQRIDAAFRQCLARAPNAEESGRLVGFYRDQLEDLRQDEESARALTSFADGVEGPEVAELAAWVCTSRVLLNLDEFLNRE